MTTASPFHDGERWVQERLGVREVEGFARKVIRPAMPNPHRAFFAELPFVVAAARDAEGRPWATLLCGEPGFVSSPDPRSLAIAACPDSGDPLEAALAPGTDLGLLGIELASRRRNRVNGRVRRRDASGIRFAVDQSFGNCPQYIRERAWRWVGRAERPNAKRSRSLDAAQRGWIEFADTFFIASGHRGSGSQASFGMDASHRGGERGFVRVEGDRRIVFPDYAGNNYFNTIGNLVVDPRVGLVFVDFASGSLLHVSGRATIDWEPPADDVARGARSLVCVDVERVLERSGALPLRWSDEAESQRLLRLVAKRPESDDVTSFVFAPRDGGVLPAFAPGQHVPIEVRIPGLDRPVRRTYSLSGPPGAPFYRISVKREPDGRVSRFLHDHVEPGALVRIGAPAGEFVLPPGDEPIVLISAGVGITPMVSMLHALARGAPNRAAHFLHGARDGRHHPMKQEVERLAAASGTQLHFAYSRPLPEDLREPHLRSVGRIDAEPLRRLAALPKADFMLCGPSGFLATVRDVLEPEGVSPERIHWETFSS